MSKELLGFQFADKAGTNIAGDDADPMCSPSFAIMRPERAIAESAKNPGFLLMPIFEGDIEEPVFID